MSMPHWEGNFSAPRNKCSHGVFNASGWEKNPECSVCVGSIASVGPTKREAMQKALETVGVRIKKVLKMREEEISQSVEAPVEENSEATNEGIETDSVEEVTEQGD